MVEEGRIIVWTTHGCSIEIILETSALNHYRSIDFDQLDQVWFVSQKYKADKGWWRPIVI